MVSKQQLPRRDFLRLSAGATAFTAIEGVAIDPQKLGARGDGTTLNTRALQRAIDDAFDRGGGTVSIPPGTFLTGGLTLRSRVMLHLEAGAILRGSSHVEDYEFHPGPAVEGDANGRHLLFAENAEDIAVIGLGTIDGNGAAFWHRKGRAAPHADELWGDVIAWDYEPATPRRPSPMLEFARCRNVRIEGVTLTNAAGWTLRPVACESVFIRGIRVRNPIYAPNTDGMDITASRNVFVTDCDIATGDDAICIKSENPYGELLPTKNITVTNCVLSTCCNGFKVGTATYGRVENIVFSNSVIYNDDAAPLNERATSGIALEVVDGGSMRGIAISNIRMENARTPIFLRLGKRTPGKGSFLRDVSIHNVHASGALLTSSITGVPAMPIEDVAIINCSFRMQEHGTVDWSKREIPEQQTHYPEARMFGRLPASGLYVRHARGIRVDSLQIHAEPPEQRPSMVCEDVEGLEIRALQSTAPSSTEPLLDLRSCREVFVQGTRAPRSEGPFLRAAGEGSKGIVLSGNEVSQTAAPVILAEGVSPDAVTSH